MLRTIKILLIISVAAWGLVGALGNILDWSGTYAAVEATASMATFEGGTQYARATSSPIVIWPVAVLIPLTKLAVGLLCLAGAWQMWSVRSGNAATFQSAKEYGLAGCGLAIGLLFMGWIVMAESWFEMWRSDIWREVALQSAFRYAGMIGLIAVLVGMRDD